MNKDKQILPYARQWLDRDDILAVSRVLKSNWITQGPKIPEFEEQLACYCQAKYAVVVGSGTAALHLACLAAGIGCRDEVVTSPVTFAASANCILYCGGKAVFADIQPDTVNIDPAEIEKKITSKTKAIIPVHFAGHPCDINEIHRLARKYKLVVIEDAAHALGAVYRGKMIGSLSDMTIFSFHPAKHITTGEGGAILTNNSSLYERLKALRTHGIRKDIKGHSEFHGPWHYEMQTLGYNYRITDFQCALGLSQLAKLNKFLEMRREIVCRYNHALRDVDELILPKEKEYVKSSWHLYVIQLKPKKLKFGRKEVFAALRVKGIGVNVHYIPVYMHPYYRRRFSYQNRDYPKAEDYYKRAITLPLFPKMRKKDVARVIRAVKNVIRLYRRES